MSSDPYFYDEWYEDEYDEDDSDYEDYEDEEVSYHLDELVKAPNGQLFVMSIAEFRSGVSSKAYSLKQAIRAGFPQEMIAWAREWSRAMKPGDRVDCDDYWSRSYEGEWDTSTCPFCNSDAIVPAREDRTTFWCNGCQSEFDEDGENVFSDDDILF